MERTRPINELLWVSYISGGMVICSILVIFIRAAFFAGPIHISEAATIIPVRSGITIGPGTEELLRELEGGGFKPMPLSEIVKPPLAVPGVLITFDSDNIQVFEYPSSGAASADAQKLEAKYANSPKTQNMIHLYQKDAVLIFYMGNNQNIFTALHALLGTADSDLQT